MRKVAATSSSGLRWPAIHTSMDTSTRASKAESAVSARNSGGARRSPTRTRSRSDSRLSIRPEPT